jgi:hypothetical protein
MRSSSSSPMGTPTQPRTGITQGSFYSAPTSKSTKGRSLCFDSNTCLYSLPVALPSPYYPIIITWIMLLAASLIASSHTQTPTRPVHVATFPKLK